MSRSPEPPLAELRVPERNSRHLDLAARCAPILCFDAREPFLPVAAGYTIFTEDGPSPSMKRDIQLRPAEQPPAARAVEYAIWWDWDIHHLYELEHVWVYLDERDEVIRVEGSWHGKFNPIPLQLQDGRPVLLSEPGKHALAGDAQPFRKRAADQRRVETRFVGAHAHVLINELFQDGIRRKPFDSTLVRSYLFTQAFEPSWTFSQAFHFAREQLVPWPALRAWIPARVNSWLERLEANLTPEDYRPLRLVSSSGALADLEAAARTGSDGVVLPVFGDPDGRPVTGLAGDGRRQTAALEDVFRVCSSVPMSAMLDLRDESCVAALAGFLKEKKVYDFAPVTAESVAWLARLKALAPRALTVAQIPALDGEHLAEARDGGASVVLLRRDGTNGLAAPLTAEEIERAHAAGLLVMSWPLERESDGEVLARRRIDALWVDRPAH